MKRVEDVKDLKRQRIIKREKSLRKAQGTLSRAEVRRDSIII